MLQNLFREEIIEGQVKENYENLVDSFIFIITLHADEYKQEWFLQDFDVLELFSEKFLHHILSINTLIQKSTYYSKLVEKKVSFFDPTSIYTLIRSQFESYLAFNHLFISSKNYDQLITRVGLWMLCGIKSKHKLEWIESNQNQIDKSSDDDIVNIISTEIKTTEIFNELSDPNKKKFFESRNFQFIIEEKNIKYIGWEEMSKRASISNDLMGLYNLLSISSHPTFPSLLQIRDMHSDSMHIDLVNIGLGIVQFLIAFMIRDYCDFSSFAFNKFKELPEQFQVLINYYNEIGRNKTYL